MIATEHIAEEPAIEQAPEISLDPRPDPSDAQAFNDWMQRQVAAEVAVDPRVGTPEKLIALRRARGDRTILTWD